MEVMALSVRLKEEGASTVKSAIDKLKGSMKDLNLTSILAGAGLGVLVKQAIDMADQMRLLEGRLKLVTSSTAELQSVQDALRDSANRTRSDYAASVELFARVARSTRDLGIAQQDLLRFTELTQMAIKTSGATSVEASAALIQLSQGLAAGALRGDEFRSVMEQIPAVAQAIAAGMGITIGELRAMSMQGELTAQQVIDAVLKMDATIRGDFASAPVTVADSFVVLKNAIREALGEINTATGATSSLASSITTLGKVVGSVASNIDGIIIAAKALGIALLAPFAAQAVAAITGYIGKMQLMIATQRQTIAMARLEATAAANTARALIAKGASADAVSAAQLRATITARNLNLQTSLLSRTMLTATTVAKGLWTAIGGPIGAIIIGIAAVSAAFDKFLNKVEEEAEAVDKASESNLDNAAALWLVQRRTNERANADENAGLSVRALSDKVAELTRREAILGQELANTNGDLVGQKVVQEALDATEKSLTSATEALARAQADAAEQVKEYRDNLAKLAGMTRLTGREHEALINAERAVAAELAKGEIPLARRIELLTQQKNLQDAIAEQLSMSMVKAFALSDAAMKKISDTAQGYYERIKKLREELAKEEAKAARKREEERVARVGISADIPSPIAPEDLFKNMRDPIREQAAQLAIDIQSTLADSVANSIQDGLTAGIMAAVSSGRIADAWKAMSQAIIQNMASAMVKIALAAIKFGTLMEKIRTFMIANPALAVASAAAMLAFAYANGGKSGPANQSFSGGMGGGGYTVAGAGVPTNNGVTRTVFGPTSATTAAGMTPRQAMNITIIGPDDPSAQRAIQELIRKGQTRGNLG